MMTFWLSAVRDGQIRKGLLLISVLWLVALHAPMAWAASSPLPMAEHATLAIEVAPNPQDTPKVKAWTELPSEAQLTITMDVARFAMKTLSEATGLPLGEPQRQFGGWKEDTNDSVAVDVPGDPARGVAVAQWLAHVLEQEAIFVVGTSPAPGLEKLPALVMRFPEGTTHESIRALYLQTLRKIHDDRGELLISGFSYAQNELLSVLETTLPVDQIEARVRTALDTAGVHVPLQVVFAYAAAVEAPKTPKTPQETHPVAANGGLPAGIDAAVLQHLTADVRARRDAAIEKARAISQ